MLKRSFNLDASSTCFSDTCGKALSPQGPPKIRKMLGKMMSLPFNKRCRKKKGNMWRSKRATRTGKILPLLIFND